MSYRPASMEEGLVLVAVFISVCTFLFLLVLSAILTQASTKKARAYFRIACPRCQKELEIDTRHGIAQCVRTGASSMASPEGRPETPKVGPPP